MYSPAIWLELDARITNLKSSLIRNDQNVLAGPQRDIGEREAHAVGQLESIERQCLGADILDLDILEILGAGAHVSGGDFGRGSAGCFRCATSRHRAIAGGDSCPIDDRGVSVGGASRGVGQRGKRLECLATLPETRVAGRTGSRAASVAAGSASGASIAPNRQRRGGDRHFAN